MATANPNGRSAEPKVVPAPQPLTPGAVAIAPAVPAPDIHQMMRDFDAAQEAHSATSRTMDTVATGREPTEAEVADHEAAEARFLEIERAFCAYVPRTIEESRAKVAFMAERHKSGHFDLYGDTFDAFLGSMGSMALAVPEEDRRQSEIDDLYGRWVAIHLHGEAEAKTDEDIQRNTDELARIAERMARVPANNAREGLIKFCVWLGIGPNGLRVGEAEVLAGAHAEVCAILGIPAPVAAPLAAAEGGGRVDAPAGEVAPVSAPTAAAQTSPILGLLREFYDLRHAASIYEAAERANIDEELEARFYKRTDAIEVEMAAIESVTPADCAAKALVFHDFGEHSCLSVEKDPFWKEARRLTGCHGVPWKEAWNPAWPAPQTAPLASPAEDQTFALIEAHRAAEQACHDASSAADLVLLGRPATAEELRAAEDALVALDAAAVALCEYAPPTLAGSQAKSARLLGCYLVESQEEIEGPIGALARSIALMVRADATPPALEIPPRFRDWWNEWLRLDDARDEMSDEEHESALNALMAVSDDVLAQPTFTAGGVAAKVIIDTRGGDFGLEPPMLAELYALSGLRRPSERSAPPSAVGGL